MSVDDADPQLKYPWQKPVLDALTEFNPKWLPLKATAAKRAISARFRDIGPVNLDEWIALQDAMRSLRILFPAESEASDKRETA